MIRPHTYAYRWLRQYALYAAMPRGDRLVAHLWGTADATRCGRPMRGMVAVHSTVAEALDADDCKSCWRNPW